ncbi:hypothetical protein [Actinoplanes friuliensis]|uniref:hypothetical protein n=1 Tax=Actinoplanes friuliensis TaxID=196914 RepID=UPI0004183F61|nr:hypothetical protein [Actinoplanes friuliensis]
MRPYPAAVVLGLAVSLTACARPGNTPSGTPTAQSRPAAQITAVPAPRGGSAVAIAPRGWTCDKQQAGRPQSVITNPGLEPEAQARARRALEAANPPLPRRGPLPEDVAVVAESCARALSLELKLLAANAGNVPDSSSVHRLLTAKGLTGVTTDTRSSFAGAIGDACVHGTFSTDGPELSIGPQSPDGTCLLVG